MSLQEHQTWELVPLPCGKNTVGCKWTYKKQQDESGHTVRCKARLVAQGFTQQYGTDYDEVFAYAAWKTILCTLLTIANQDNMVVQHLDIKTAYLYADLKEEVYMQPPSSVKADEKVCRAEAEST